MWKHARKEEWGCAPLWFHSLPEDAVTPEGLASFIELKQESVRTVERDRKRKSVGEQGRIFLHP